jgi:hypothetical protein
MISKPTALQYLSLRRSIFNAGMRYILDASIRM